MQINFIYYRNFAVCGLRRFLGGIRDQCLAIFITKYEDALRISTLVLQSADAA